MVVDALAHGMPVITTKGCPWSEIDGKCGWWIERTVPQLAETMARAIELSNTERVQMGENGKRLIQEKYTWPAVAKQMISAYAEL